jgi:hypothetical protein
MQCRFGGQCHGGPCVFELARGVQTIPGSRAGDDIACDGPPGVGVLTLCRQLDVEASSLPLRGPAGASSRARVGQRWRSQYQLRLEP